MLDVTERRIKLHGKKIYNPLFKTSPTKYYTLVQGIFDNSICLGFVRPAFDIDKKTVMRSKKQLNFIFADKFGEMYVCDCSFNLFEVILKKGIISM